MLVSVLAIVDIGSNSVKILVAKMQQGVLEELHIDSETTSLARGLPQTGRISQESIASTLDVMRRFRKDVDRLQVKNVQIVGTAALREASNPEDLTKTIEEIMGSPVSIISGEEEARLSLRGALTARPDTSSEKECSFVDLGGASTELGYLHPELQIVSTSLGALKTHNLLEIGGEPTPDKKWQEAKEFISSILKKEVAKTLKKEIQNKKTFIAVGGTIVMACKAMGLKDFKQNCFHFQRNELETFADKLRKIPDFERAQIPELSKDRADILPFGMMVLTEAMKFFGQKTGISTVRGLRHGLALNLLDPKP